MAFMNLAHRGASAYAPENTLAAFYKGIEMGANGLEFDLRHTRDGVIVVIHDETVDRTSDGTGRVSEYTWEQLSKLDAGSWFSSKYTGERIVTFQEFLYYFGRKPLLFAIELKEPGLEQEVCRLLHEHHLVDRSTITSFDFEILRSVRDIDPHLSIGYLTQQISTETVDQVLSIQGQQICPRAEHLEANHVAVAQQLGLSVRAWGVYNETLMEHVKRCKADGMTINFPDKLSL